MIWFDDLIILFICVSFHTCTKTNLQNQDSGENQWLHHPSLKHLNKDEKDKNANIHWNLWEKKQHWNVYQHKIVV